MLCHVTRFEEYNFTEFVGFKNFVPYFRGNRATVVRPKKFLGQHFLNDQGIAKRIVEGLTTSGKSNVLEIGPGMGVLTKFLVQDKSINLKVIEIDWDSVAYLRQHYPALSIMEGDFLELDLKQVFGESFSVIGNFPYNISSQIFFKVLEQRNMVDQVVCMLQKEVADRIAEPPGSKTYGILSVLLQAFYDIEYLFKVPPGVFIPPPKVMSAVIRLTRNKREKLDCNEALFFQVVKQGFNNRRKTLRNALKNLNLAAEFLTDPIFDLRAERLSVDQFVYITQLTEKSRGGTDAV
ncbi:MAG: 16S rRNA (adenine(1518)-N(6)/adenine(1519)-N(6))-dimethyltransferase RsmA [Cyclobacteriaceae bacterium]|nr:16S rRNA (adenine(1518)-N(6)/adenine(1519)-N(6))-dimethyltransferase RsmA [Cyclobacteriaceae bacterium]